MPNRRQPGPPDLFSSGPIIIGDAAAVQLPPGARHWPSALDVAAQRALLDDVARVIEAAPFYTPAMPRTGKPFSVVMTNCGSQGWVSDKTGGYRYQPTHPATGAAWPPIPDSLLDIWRRYADYSAFPEACLVNHYGGGTKLGSHVDSDEPNREAPVVSVSLGCDAIFHVGGLKRGDQKVRVTLRSGDVFVLGGESRSAHHGIDRILAGTSDLVSSIIPEGGRINLTMRRVSPA